MPTEPKKPEPGEILGQLIFGKCATMVCSVAAKLRIADKLAAGPKSAADLAAETNTHAPTLSRVLRCLAGFGVFTEAADGTFALNPAGELLRTGVPGSMRGMAEFCGDTWTWDAWGDLLYSVRTGKTAFDHVFNKGCFEYLAEHKDESEVFNEAMTGFSGMVAPAVVEAYDFSKFGTIVDVGGGHGKLLTTVLKENPGVKGIVYDAPHVAAGAADAIRSAGLADRCKAEGGNFFKAVPAGGDAYMMMHIIHDWPDDKATTILKNCRKGVSPGGKLLVVDSVVAPPNEPDAAKILDLEMLILPGGKERTEAEFVSLYAGAGWRLTRVVRTKSPKCVIEGVPV
ncbi:MAG TPA: methyltransferase [Fimbriiglobus sp.]|jgi:2-polyprenyl-3-methyl-5-hydroxy-6-metoxy-1,4-benzoquinol methylase